MIELFDEERMRQEIADTWGKRSRHLELFDKLLKENNRLRYQIEHQRPELWKELDQKYREEMTALTAKCDELRNKIEALNQSVFSSMRELEAKIKSI